MTPGSSTELYQRYERTPQKTLSFEITAVYSEHYKKVMNKICGLTAHVLNVNAGGVYSYHCALNLPNLAVTANSICLNIIHFLFHVHWYLCVSCAVHCKSVTVPLNNTTLLVIIMRNKSNGCEVEVVTYLHEYHWSSIKLLKPSGNFTYHQV
jgi:hypothetical protein